MLSAASRAVVYSQSSKCVYTFCELMASGLASSPSGHERKRSVQICDSDYTTHGVSGVSARRYPHGAGRILSLRRGRQLVVGRHDKKFLANEAKLRPVVQKI